MDKQMVVYLYDGTLLSNKKEWPFNNMEQAQVESSRTSGEWKKWKKPQLKGHMVYDSIYMTFDKDKIRVTGWGFPEGLTMKGSMRECFGVIELFRILMVVVLK